MVSFQHVGKDYVRGTSTITALSDICVDIPDGQFFAITGPSGSGKSTFLNLIAGLDHPTSGHLLLHGRSTRNFGDREWTMARRKWIGIVFQAFHLIPGLTAEDNIALPLRLQDKPLRVIRESVENMLEIVGLRSRALHRSGELSGGEQQRVAIARAFIHQPQLILADEPTGNLDSQNGMEIVSLLKRCSQEFGQTVIMVTHSQVAAAVADSELTLCDGRLT